MDAVSFDIFSGIPEEQGLWVESVTGLSMARERMAQIAKDVPGTYFLFCGDSLSIIARTRTLKPPPERPTSLQGV